MTNHDGRRRRSQAGDLSIGISLLSLLVALAAFINTITEQDREAKRKETLIRPELRLIVHNQGGEVGITVRNYGLGPALLYEVAFDIENGCFESSKYTFSPRWSDLYRDTILPSLERILHSSIKQELTKTIEGQPFDHKAKSVKTGQSELRFRFDRTKIDDPTNPISGVVDIYEYRDVDLLLDSKAMSLGPGGIISPGEEIPVLRVAIQMRDHMTRKQMELTLQQQNATEKSLRHTLEKIKIGIGYCSTTGESCDFIALGELACFQRYRDGAR